MKHLSGVMRTLLSRMVLTEARTSAVNLGFWNSYSRTSISICSSGGWGLLSSEKRISEGKSTNLSMWQLDGPVKESLAF